MNRALLALVIVFTLSAILPPAIVYAGGDPPPQIPPVTYTCATLNGISNYTPAQGDSGTALQAVNCPKIGKWIAGKINGTTYYVNKGIIALADLKGVTSDLAKAIIKKLSKGK